MKNNDTRSREYSPYEDYLMSVEVCEICNNHAADLRCIQDNRDIFHMLKEDIPKPKVKKTIKLFKEKIVIILIAFCCAVLSIQHVVLTLNAANNGIENAFYAGWASDDAIICLLMMITLVADYIGLMIIRRRERGL